MRKTYDKAFKARVALEALRGEKTIQELGQIHGVHPNLITEWKKLLIDNAANIFERPGKVSDGDLAAERGPDQNSDPLADSGLLQTAIGKEVSSRRRRFRECCVPMGSRSAQDGVNRALDNIYVERLWRTLKYEEIYLKDYQSLSELKMGLNRYFSFYNGRRFHQSLGYMTPNQVYVSRFSAAEELENAA